MDQLLCRAAAQTDWLIVQQLVNSHESSIDPAAPTMGEPGIRDLIQGYVDESVAELVFSPGEGSAPLGFIQLHPDANRRRFFPDIYLATGSDSFVRDFCVARMVEQTRALHPEWDVLPGVNSLDFFLRDALLAAGFEFRRRFWSLRKPLAPSESAPDLPPGVTLHPVEPGDWSIVHALHQDAFANHYGFVPRDRDSWVEMQLASNTREPAGEVVLRVDGAPAAFLLSANEMEHENGGYVDLLGVASDFRGRGLGRILLQWAIAYNAGLGRGQLDLNVDTGNTSGALGLYESCGFAPISSWDQLGLPRSSIAPTSAFAA